MIKQVKSTQSKFANHIIYHRIPLDFPQIFVLLYFPLLAFVFLLFLFPYCCCCFFFKLKIYILIQTRLCGWMNDRNIFTRVISGNKITFFWLYIDQDLFLCNVVWSLFNNVAQGFYLFNLAHG